MEYEKTLKMDSKPYLVCHSDASGGLILTWYLNLKNQSNLRDLYFSLIQVNFELKVKFKNKFKLVKKSLFSSTSANLILKTKNLNLGCFSILKIS